MTTLAQDAGGLPGASPLANARKLALRRSTCDDHAVHAAQASAGQQARVTADVFRCSGARSIANKHGVSIMPVCAPHPKSHAELHAVDGLLTGLLPAHVDGLTC